MTTKTELLADGVIVATKTSAPFTDFTWDSTGTTGAVALTVKWYVDGALVETSDARNITVNAAGDVTAPTITSATVEDANPSTLVVVFSEVVTITDTTGLTIAGDVTPTLSSPTGSGTNTLSFTLSTPLTNGQSVTLEVAGTNTITDTSANSNPLAATSQAITNNVAAASVSIDGIASLYNKLVFSDSASMTLDGSNRITVINEQVSNVSVNNTEGLYPLFSTDRSVFSTDADIGKIGSGEVRGFIDGTVDFQVTKVFELNSLTDGSLLYVDSISRLAIGIKSGEFLVRFKDDTGTDVFKVGTSAIAIDTRYKIIIKRTAGVYSAELNGVALTTTTTNATFFGISGFFLNKPLSTVRANFDLFEYLAFTASLTGSDKTTHDNYINTKYGV